MEQPRLPVVTVRVGPLQFQALLGSGLNDSFMTREVRDAIINWQRLDTGRSNYVADNIPMGVRIDWNSQTGGIGFKTGTRLKFDMILGYHALRLFELNIDYSSGRYTLGGDPTQVYAL